MEQQKLTEEQKQDIEDRTKYFESEYEALIEKYQVYHSVVPQYVQVAPGIFATISNFMVIDKKYKPVESPYKDKILEE